MGRKDWDFCLAAFAGDLAQKVFRESAGIFPKISWYRKIS
jgi:hypothetical protein